MTANLLLSARWLLALVLLTAASFKLAETPAQRLEAIRRYEVVPAGAVRAAAWSLPWVEALLGLALAAGIFVSVAAVLTCVLMVSFATVMSWHLASGRTFDCGCGTGHQRDISWRLVAGDAALATLELLVVVGPGGELAAFPGWAISNTHAEPVVRSLAMPLLAVLVVVSWPLFRLVPSQRPSLWRLRRGRDGGVSVRPMEVQ